MKIQELLIEGYEVLKKANIDTYMIDVQLLLAKVLNKDKLFIITNRFIEVKESEVQKYNELLSLRKDKMPIKYILGNCEFMGLDFNVKAGILIPRADTEILVEDAIKDIEKFHFKSIADLCCGSGAIGISIAKFVESTKVKCYDISNIAIEVTEENIKSLKLEHRVQAIKSDLLENAIKNNDKFDMIVSNPPYIKEAVIPTLMEDVKNYEPYIALCGGEDGLDFYRRIIIDGVKVLNSNGILAFEIGYDQGKAVSSLLQEAGFENIVCIKDLSGNDRVVKAKVNSFSG